MSVIVPREYGIYLFGLSAICLVLLIVTGVLIFVGPERWRQTK